MFSSLWCCLGAKPPSSKWLGSSSYDSSWEEGEDDPPTIPPQYKASIYTYVNARYPEERFKSRTYNIRWGKRSAYKVHWSKKVGEGSYGAVYMATHMPSGEKVVVKTMKPEKANTKRLKMEIMNLKLVSDGPNIIRFLDLVRDKKRDLAMIVFEYIKQPLPCAKLYARMKPDESVWYLYALLRALHFTHALGIMHLDVKPTNTLYNPKTRELKLIDWGFAAFYWAGVKLARWPGTRYTKSPELFLHYKYYDYATDVWSFGCIMGALLFNRYPFFPCPKDDDKIEWNKNQMVSIVSILGVDDYVRFLKKYSKYMSYTHIFPLRLFQRAGCSRSRLDLAALAPRGGRPAVSDAAIDLLNRIFVYDPELRITARDALLHPYFDAVRSPEDDAMLRSIDTATAPPPDDPALCPPPPDATVSPHNPLPLSDPQRFALSSSDSASATNADDDDQDGNNSCDARHHHRPDPAAGTAPHRPSSASAERVLHNPHLHPPRASSSSSPDAAPARLSSASSFSPAPAHHPRRTGHKGKRTRRKVLATYGHSGAGSSIAMPAGGDSTPADREEDVGLSSPARQTSASVEYEYHSTYEYQYQYDGETSQQPTS
ncbi:CMGC/CK2 protein kinase [Thecamonas trahens ATCC 50062]|uniref:non-specific serine/threonine protein kinase n=1 Tax=Thecamonas trahens ATCC 50062 TaxID=461836 RepID=A0A0L0DAD3_THETB|nr:CMGC/CK2 protein kinase [Thecamonas trahens ATCC 50062]KNC49195.1 CMGC/CK2 protein kinase [Thecamonas trahens ATCC 50062]|eukprot:XP_013758213.1 CMGC/CK2 protein kinase [Thecamonas trahens ATCC 50062]